MPKFKQIPAAELPEGVVSGYAHDTIMIDVPKYLNYLLEKVKQLGVKIIRAELPHSGLEAALDATEEILRAASHANKNAISVFVNATGLAARHLVPDKSVYPVRGLTVLVEGVARQTTTVQYGVSEDDSSSIGISYVLPRSASGTSVIGGTKQSGSSVPEPFPGEAEALLQRAKSLAPELLGHDGEFKVLEISVGLRPGRKGGARVEMEDIGNRVVCHAYGHGGAGYQNSIGVARKTLRLIAERLG